MNNNFTDEMLEKLRESVKGEMGDRRYFHTLEVEKMAMQLGELYAPDDVPMLRAAALLHDVTKEKTAEEHIAICERCGIAVSEGERKSPKMFHSKTAALIIPERYPEFASERLLRAVRYHTTGRADMSIEEKIIYLADYIDMSREFGDCVTLREYFFDFDFESADEAARMHHLNQTLIKSYDFTIRGLIEGKKHINENTFEARNFLVLQL